MSPADTTASPRFGRRGVAAGSALGLSTLGVDAPAGMGARDPGGVFALRGFPPSPLDTAAFMLARADGDRDDYAFTVLLFERQRA